MHAGKQFIHSFRIGKKKKRKEKGKSIGGEEGGAKSLQMIVQFLPLLSSIDLDLVIAVVVVIVIVRKRNDGLGGSLGF